MQLYILYVYMYSICNKLTEMVVTPLSCIARTNSSLSSFSTLLTPSSPEWAKPHKIGRPRKTARAPRASAYTAIHTCYIQLNTTNSIARWAYLDDISTASDTTIQVYLNSASDSAADLSKDLDRGGSGIQLPRAVIGHPDSCIDIQKQTQYTIREHKSCAYTYRQRRVWRK